MDADFLQKLKRFSVKDVFEDQRPVTGRVRTSKARSQPPTVLSEDGGDGSVMITGNNAPQQSSSLFSVRSQKPGGPSTIADVLKNAELENMKRAAELAESRNQDNLRVNSASSDRSAKSARQRENVDYIPDLDDLRKEELTMTVAAAPVVEVERLTSLRELDADLTRIKSFSVVRGVDLRRLARFVIPQKNLADYKIPSKERERSKKHANYQQLKSELTPYFNKRHKFELPKNPDGTPILADQVKKNQVKAKELGLGDQTFAIDKLIFPRENIFRKGIRLRIWILSLVSQPQQQDVDLSETITNENVFIFIQPEDKLF